MPDAEVPQFRVRNEGEPIPPVDPAALRRRWNIKPPRDREAWIAQKEAWIALGQESDSAAASRRCWMIRVLTGFNHGQLLAPWQDGEELDDAVFRIGASFPLRPFRQDVYKFEGDELWGFDPNAFVQRLIEETGISHLWEPVPAKVSEGCFSYTKLRATYNLQRPPDPEREARHDAGELLWAVWSKCQPNLSRPSSKDEHEVGVIAMLFADFAIDNIGLAREFVSAMKGVKGRTPSAILADVEHRAVWETVARISGKTPP